MPLIQVNAIGDTPCLHGSGAEPLHAEDLVTARGPAIVMIHGYKFLPGDPRHCPHRHILSLDTTRACWKALSWPRHLGFGRGNPGEGLAVAFGWSARGSIWRAYDEAVQAGHALARLIEMLKAAAPDRPVHILAHSLGARVALRALSALDAPLVERVILMAGAEFAGPAQAALASPAGRAAELVNVTSRENDLYDFLLESLIAAPKSGDRTISHGLAEAARCVTLQLDDPETLGTLAGLGFPIAPPARRVCHWSGYLRPGVFPLYQALLRRPETLPIDLLRTRLPETPHPRWSRLWPAAPQPRPLQAAQ